MVARKIGIRAYWSLVWHSAATPSQPSNCSFSVSNLARASRFLMWARFAKSPTELSTTVFASKLGFICSITAPEQKTNSASVSTIGAEGCSVMGGDRDGVGELTRSTTTITNSNTVVPMMDQPITAATRVGMGKSGLLFTLCANPHGLSDCFTVNKWFEFMGNQAILWAR